MKLKKYAMSLSITLVSVGHVLSRPAAAQGIPIVPQALAGPTHAALVVGIPGSLARRTGQQRTTPQLTDRLDWATHADDEVLRDSTPRRHRTFRKYVANGLLIGGTAGIVVGAVVARNDDCRDCMVPSILAVPAFALVGAAAGAVLGGLTWLIVETPARRDAPENQQ